MLFLYEMQHSSVHHLFICCKIVQNLLLSSCIDNLFQKFTKSSSISINFSLFWIEQSQTFYVRQNNLQVVLGNSYPAACRTINNKILIMSASGAQLRPAVYRWWLMSVVQENLVLFVESFSRRCTTRRNVALKWLTSLYPGLRTTQHSTTTRFIFLEIHFLFKARCLSFFFGRALIRVNSPFLFLLCLLTSWTIATDGVFILDSFLWTRSCSISSEVACFREGQWPHLLLSIRSIWTVL